MTATPINRDSPSVDDFVYQLNRSTEVLSAFIAAHDGSNMLWLTSEEFHNTRLKLVKWALSECINAATEFAHYMPEEFCDRYSHLPVDVSFDQIAQDLRAVCECLYIVGMRAMRDEIEGGSRYLTLEKLLPPPPLFGIELDQWVEAAFVVHTAAAKLENPTIESFYSDGADHPNFVLFQQARTALNALGVTAPPKPHDECGLDLELLFRLETDPGSPPDLSH